MNNSKSKKLREGFTQNKLPQPQPASGSTQQRSNQKHKIKNLPTGMAEVVTAVACEECDAIVMVTIVLLVICVCGTEPEQVGDRFLIFLRED